MGALASSPELKLGPTKRMPCQTRPASPGLPCPACLACPARLAGAWALSRVLWQGLVGITPSYSATFIATTILLTGVSIAGRLLPALRATRVDPVVALRAEWICLACPARTACPL